MLILWCGLDQWSLHMHMHIELMVMAGKVEHDGQAWNDTTHMEPVMA